MQVNREPHGEKIKSCLHQHCLFNLLMILRHGIARRKIQDGSDRKFILLKQVILIDQIFSLK